MFEERKGAVNFLLKRGQDPACMTATESSPPMVHPQQQITCWLTATAHVHRLTCTASLATKPQQPTLIYSGKLNVQSERLYNIAAIGTAPMAF